MLDARQGISDRFFEAVRQHLATNFLEFDLRPAIMGIFGPAGEGKTYQLERSIEACNTEMMWINAGDLESDSAGAPARLIVDVIKAASKEIAQGVPTAVVLHDIDTTLGEWKDNTGTVNHQHVLAELMHFADKPDSPRRGGKRVPIFATGNDASKLYEPLTRARRMALFHWAPTSAEKIAIVHSIISNVSAEEVSALLVEAFPQHPVAFFADVAGAAAEVLSQRVEMARVSDMRQLVSGRARGKVSSGIIRGQLLGSGEVLRLAELIAQERTYALRSHLKEPSL